MKSKIAAAFLALIAAFALFALPAQAAGAGPRAGGARVTYTYGTDGSYFVTRIYTHTSPAGAGLRSGARATKETEYHSSSGVEWVYRVTGSFYYDGHTSYATSASSSYSILVSGWACTADSAYCSGATATANGTFTYLQLTKNATVSLSCDRYGNLS